MSHRKEESVIKDKIMSIRLTAAEKSKLQEIVTNSGYSTLAQYIRGEILAQTIIRHVIISKEDIASAISPSTQAQLIKIGNNLNQANKVFHSLVLKNYLTPDAAETYILRIDKILARLLKLTEK